MSEWHHSCRPSTKHSKGNHLVSFKLFLKSKLVLFEFELQRQEGSTRIRQGSDGRMSRVSQAVDRRLVEIFSHKKQK